MIDQNWHYGPRWVSPSTGRLVAEQSWWVSPAGWGQLGSILLTTCSVPQSDVYCTRSTWRMKTCTLRLSQCTSCKLKQISIFILNIPNFSPVGWRQSNSQCGTLSLHHADLYIKHQNRLFWEINLVTFAIWTIARPTYLPFPHLWHRRNRSQLQLIGCFQVGQTLCLGQDTKVLINVCAVHSGKLQLHIWQ